METALKLEISRDSTGDAIIVSGNIDAKAESLLRDVPRQVSPPMVRFDFSQAGRINSMGIALLLRCFRSIKEERRADICISGLNTMNAMLFKMTGVFLIATQIK